MRDRSLDTWDCALLSRAAGVGCGGKVVHLSMDEPSYTGVVTVNIELDTLGTAVQTGRWRTLARVNLTADNGYFVPYVFTSSPLYCAMGRKVDFVYLIAAMPGHA